MGRADGRHRAAARGSGHRLAEGSPRPVSLKELAARTPRRKVTWREGTKGKLSGPVRLAAGLAGPGLGDRASAPGPSRSGC